MRYDWLSDPVFLDARSIVAGKYSEAAESDSWYKLGRIVSRGRRKTFGDVADACGFVMAWVGARKIALKIREGEAIGR